MSASLQILSGGLGRLLVVMLRPQCCLVLLPSVIRLVKQCAALPLETMASNLIAMASSLLNLVAHLSCAGVGHQPL